MECSWWVSPSSQGFLITGMLFFYLLVGIAAGYVTVRMWRTLKGGNYRGWKSISWCVPYFFPVIAFLILTLLSFLLWGSQSFAVLFATGTIGLLTSFGLCITCSLLLN
jgi:hypothetical protein